MKLFIVIVALCFQSSAFCQSAYGRVDCGQWLNDQAPLKFESQSWVLGYLSGLNAGVNISNGRDALIKLNSQEQVFLWMDKYCRVNPLEMVRTGATKLFIELSERK